MSAIYNKNASVSSNGLFSFTEQQKGWAGLGGQESWRALLLGEMNAG